MLHPLIPWLLPARAPTAAAREGRSSWVRPTCISEACHLGPPTRTSSNSANREYSEQLPLNTEVSLSHLPMSLRGVLGPVVLLMAVCNVQLPLYITHSSLCDYSQHKHHSTLIYLIWKLDLVSILIFLYVPRQLFKKQLPLLESRYH